MRKSIKNLAILTVGVAFASCGQNDVFEQNQNAFIEQQKSEYRANYIKKYGEVSATQSWDFTNLSGSQAKTRAGETLNIDWLWPANLFWSFVENDLSVVDSKIATAEVKEWNPYLAVNLYPTYCHIPKGNSYRSYNLAVCYNGETEEFFSKSLVLLVNGWHYLARAGREINTKSLTTANNVFWAAYPREDGGWFKDDVIPGSIEDYKINDYKELKVNGRTYWCFRCSEKGDYSDLVCMVENIDPVKPVAKRYFVEDLGSKDDFDFNDIVFDVVQDLQGNQKAIVRAMGGTIDFTLQIGNTKWTKSVEGVAAGYNVSTMYNTSGDVVWDKVLAEFPVTGWDPTNNNISVSVKSTANNGVIITIPFSKVGEIPMIIAFDTVVDWQKERVSLPSDWWKVPDTEEAE